MVAAFSCLLSILSKVCLHPHKNRILLATFCGLDDSTRKDEKRKKEETRIEEKRIEGEGVTIPDNHLAATLSNIPAEDSARSLAQNKR